MTEELCTECGLKHIGKHTHRMASPQSGELWRHFKGDLYKIIARGQLERDGTEMVVYRNADGSGPNWIRSLTDFVSKADPHSYHSSELDMQVEKGEVWRFTFEKPVEGKIMPRDTLVSVVSEPTGKILS